MTRSDAGGGRRGRLRRRARRIWLAVRWPLLGLLVVAAFALGYAGFHGYLGDLGEPRPLTRILYLTVQLFVLESGAVSPPTPWTLEAARWLAPAVTLYSAAAAFAAVFREELGRARLRFYRGHVVVCGLGDRGVLLVRSFRAAGHRVAAVDRDGAVPGVASARSAGAVVLAGDACDPETLDRLRVRLASVVVSVCGDDTIDAGVAAAVQRIAPRRADPIRVFAHVADPALRMLLQRGELMRPAGHALVELFDVFDRGAGAMLTRLPPGTGDKPPRIAVVGLDPLGAALIVKAVRWWRDRGTGQGRIQIVAVDGGASEIVESLGRRHPGLESVADIVPVDLSIASGELMRFGWLAGAPLDAAYVCVDGDVWALGVAAGLAGEAPTIVRVASPTATVPGRVEAFALLEETCTPEVLLGGLYERLARAIHADYVRREKALGHSPETNPSMAPWEDLSDDLRASNRAQAADIGAKLATLGCDIEPAGEWDEPLLVLEPGEVESLARQEHERWMDRLLDDGWRSGSAKDPHAKTHPDLVPYEDLDEETREADRSAVRGMPAFLEMVGMRAVRR